MRISDILKEVQKEQVIYENYGWVFKLESHRKTEEM